MDNSKLTTMSQPCEEQTTGENMKDALIRESAINEACESMLQALTDMQGTKLDSKALTEIKQRLLDCRDQKLRTQIGSTLKRDPPMTFEDQRKEVRKALKTTTNWQSGKKSNVTITRDHSPNANLMKENCASSNLRPPPPSILEARSIIEKLNSKMNDKKSRNVTPQRKVVHDIPKIVLPSQDSRSNARLCKSPQNIQLFSSPRGAAKDHKAELEASNQNSKQILNSPSHSIARRLKSPLNSPSRSTVRDAVDKMLAKIISSNNSEYHRDRDINDNKSYVSQASFYKPVISKPTFGGETDHLGQSFISKMIGDDSSIYMQKSGSNIRTRSPMGSKASLIEQKSSVKLNETLRSPKSKKININLTRAEDGSIPLIEIESEDNHHLQIRVNDATKNKSSASIISPRGTKLSDGTNPKRQDVTSYLLKEKKSLKSYCLNNSGILHKNSQRTIAIDLSINSGSQQQNKKIDEYGLSLRDKGLNFWNMGESQTEIGSNAAINDGLCTPRQRDLLKNDVTKENIGFISSTKKNLSHQKEFGKTLITTADRNSSQSKLKCHRIDSIRDLEEIESLQNQINSRFSTLDGVLRGNVLK